MGGQAIHGTAETRRFVKGEHEVVPLHQVDLEIGVGEFLVLLGPSGSGKTTLLRARIFALLANGYQCELLTLKDPEMQDDDEETLEDESESSENGVEFVADGGLRTTFFDPERRRSSGGNDERHATRLSMFDMGSVSNVRAVYKHGSSNLATYGEQDGDNMVLALDVPAGHGERSRS